MIISFESCNNGHVTFETNHDEVGNGSFEIGRITDIMNMHCSGGISDNMDSRTISGEQRIDLISAREGINASEHDRGEFTVHGGVGDLEFRSPLESGKHLLTFDPRRMQIRINDASGVVLSSFDGAFEHESHGHDGDDDHNYDCETGMGMGMSHNDDDNHGTDDCVEDGEVVEIEVDLVNSGQLQGAMGEAEWEMSASHIEFSVEIEDIPAGNYPLLIGGKEVGTIVAPEVLHSGVFGRIMFRDPQMYGGYPLDFDPRGQTIEVMQQGNVILTVDFPEE